MITELKKESVTAVPPSTVSTAVVGAGTVFEPATDFAVDAFQSFASDESQAVSVYEAGPIGEGLMAQIAEASLDRAKAFPNSARAWVQAGFAALAAHDLHSATRAFNSALEVEPGLRSPRLGLARAAHEGGNPQEAERILRELINEGPNDVQARVSLAVVLIAARRWEEALALLDLPPEATSRNASVLATRGSIRFVLGDIGKAVSDLRKAVRIRPDWVHARNVLGLTELRRGRAGAAEQHFREAVRTGPMYLEPHLNLVRLLAHDKRWKEVLESIEQYWKPGHSSVEISWHAAAAALETGDARTARDWLEPVVAEARAGWERATILNNLGVAYSRLDNWAEADRRFLESVEASPGLTAIENRAIALLETGFADEAINWLLVWEARERFQETSFLRLLSTAYLRAGRWQKSLDLAEDLISRADKDVNVYCLLSALYADYADRPEDGARIARDGLQRFPDSTTLRNDLAYSLLLLNRPDEAEEWLLSVDESGASMRDLVHLTATRGLLELYRGQVTEGQRLYEKALAMAPSNSLRERVRVKRDLEIGRALLRLGKPQREATRFFERAAQGQLPAEPYVSQARHHLRLLQKSPRPPQIGPGDDRGS